MNDIRKDWINTLGVILISYATFTDGELSQEEQDEITKKLRNLCVSIDGNHSTTDAESDFITRFGEIKRWFYELNQGENFADEFMLMLEELPKLSFWSKEKSIITCRAIYEVADSDNEIEHSESDVLTDIMVAWDVDIEDIEEE